MLNKILLIDDDPDIIETLVSLLEGEDFEIVTTDNAKTALEILQSQSFQAIVSDISMPQMSGLEFMEKLRKFGNKTPLLFLSGRDLSKEIRETLVQGAAEFMAKPFDIDHLIAKVHQFVEQSNSLENVIALRNHTQNSALKVNHALKDVA